MSDRFSDSVSFRLCSGALAEWLESLEGLSPDAVVPVPKSPADRFGLMFGRALDRKAREIGTISGVLASPPEGLVMARPSDLFASVGFVVSVVHAAASAGVIALGRDHHEADELERFVNGASPYDRVPRHLARGGAYSFLGRSDAERLGAWLRAIPRAEYGEGVVDMFGKDAAPTYRSALESISRILESVRVHGADLCCVADAYPE